MVAFDTQAFGSYTTGSIIHTRKGLMSKIVLTLFVATVLAVASMTVGTEALAGVDIYGW